MSRNVVQALLVLLVAAPIAAKVVYVNQAATGKNDGSSWADAFVDLQDGLAAAVTADEIWVAAGSYSPGASRTASFQLKSSIALYGGFAGGETSLGDRDPERNITTLTGSPSNNYHVCTGAGATGALLDGFTISGGLADDAHGSPNASGAGITDAAGLTIQHCLFTRNRAVENGAAIVDAGTVRDSVFRSNSIEEGRGSAIFGASSLVNCLFERNGAGYGGAVFNPRTVVDCTFLNNDSYSAAGAVVCNTCDIVRSSFSFNCSCDGGPAGAVLIRGTGSNIVGCRFNGNGSLFEGAGAVVAYEPVAIADCLFSDTYGPYGARKPLALAPGSSVHSVTSFAPKTYPAPFLEGSSVVVTNSIVWNHGATPFIGSPIVGYSDVQGGFPGTGNIDVDPQFVAAAAGDFHLLSGSPCIDVGDQASLPPDRLDLDGDGNTTEPIPYDMDGRPRVWNGAVDMGTYEWTSNRPWDRLVGEGLGPPNANRVKVYDGAGRPTSVDFQAYGAGRWGVNVASDDIDGGMTGEILTGPGPGAVYGPTVHAFRADGTSIAKVNFYAYGTLRYGVNVSAGNVDGDAYAEILTGAGPGAVFGPHVRCFDFDNASVTTIAKISFFAYSTLKYGVNVSSGDLDYDGYGEVLAGPGPSPAFAPLVRAFNYDNIAISAIAKINFWPFSVLQYGVIDGGGDVDADDFAEIAAAPGPGPGSSFPSRFLGFNYDGSSISSLAGFDVTAFPGSSYGGRPGLGDVNADGRADLLCAAGPDPAGDSTIKGYWYDGAKLPSLLGSFMPFGAAAYGANVAAADLGH